MSETEQFAAGVIADAMIEREVTIQDKMWGDANERADATNNQLMNAAVAQLILTLSKAEGAPPLTQLSAAGLFYPPDWNGLRDYGSFAANLVVAAAFIRSEIKRRVLLGEDLTRTKRGEAYKGPDLPYMSAEEATGALGQLK
jgi:hypothetical protein